MQWRIAIRILLIHICAVFQQLVEYLHGKRDTRCLTTRNAQLSSCLFSLPLVGKAFYLIPLVSNTLPIAALWISDSTHCIVSVDLHPFFVQQYKSGGNIHSSNSGKQSLQNWKKCFTRWKLTRYKPTIFSILRCGCLGQTNQAFNLFLLSFDIETKCGICCTLPFCAAASRASCPFRSFFRTSDSLLFSKKCGLKR